MNRATIGRLLSLAVYGSAVAGSAWLLDVARHHGFSWWWPLAVAAISMAYVSVGGPCDGGRLLRRRSTTIEWLAVGVFAAAAGWLTLAPGREGWAALCWLGLLIACAAAGCGPCESVAVGPEPVLNLKWRRLLIGSVLALALAGAAASLAGSPEHTVVGLVLWVVALFVVLWGCWGSAVYREDHTDRTLPPVGVEIAILVAILAAAVFLRVVGLGDVPVHVDGDEGRIGMHIADTFRGLKESPFDFGWNGFSQVMLVAHGAWMKVFGVELESLRLGSATAGAFGVLLLYLFLRELCGWRTAVLGAALLAANPEHLSWSRAGMMNAQAITMVTLAMAALAAALRRGRLVWWAVLGISLGGCMMTYHGAKSALGVVAVVMLVEVVGVRRRWRPLGVGVVVTAVALLVTVLPQVPAAVDRWDWYSAEIGKRFEVHRLVDAVAVGDHEQVRQYLRGHVGSVVAVPVASHQGGFVPAGALLDPASAVMVVGAPLWLLVWWRHRSARIVLVWIAVYALSSGFLTSRPPYKPRLVMALPAVVAAAAMVIDLSGRWRAGGRSRWIWILPWALGAVCVGGGLAEAWNRHVDPFSPGFVTSDPKSSLIRVLRDLRDEGWVGSDPVMLIGATNRHEANLFFSQRHGLLGTFDDLVDVGDDVAALPIVDPQGRRHLVIVAPHQEVLLSVLRAHYPGAPLLRILGARGETMYNVVRLDEARVRGGWGWRRLDGDRGPENPIQRPPFVLEGNGSGSWGGGLYVPVAGRLGLEVSGCAAAGFRIDGWPESDGTRTAWMEVAQGWHDVQVHAQAPAAGCVVEPRWVAARTGSWGVIPAWALRPEGDPGGLLLRLWRWRGREWSEEAGAGHAPDLWRVDPVLSYDFDMVESQETLPAMFHSGQWLARWDGTVRVPRTSVWTVELGFDTAWAELEVGMFGARADEPGVVRLEAPLAAGDHRLTVRTGADVQAPLRRLVIKLRWAADGDSLEAVPYGSLVPPPDLMVRPIDP